MQRLYGHVTVPFLQETNGTRKGTHHRGSQGGGHSDQVRRPKEVRGGGLGDVQASASQKKLSASIYWMEQISGQNHNQEQRLISEMRTGPASQEDTTIFRVNG